MFKYLLCVALLFGDILNESEIQVPVKAEDRVANKEGNCAWCSIEVLGRIAKEPKLVGLTETDSRCKGSAYPEDAKRVLKSRGVLFKMNPRGIKTRQAIEEFLVKPCKEGRGVAVGVYLPNGRRHMLNVLHYDIPTQTVMIFDNSDRDLRIRKWDWKKFHRDWDGWCIVIFKET